MKNKKVVIIAIIAVIIIAIVVAGVMYARFNAEQLQILAEEADKLGSMDIATENIDMEIKSKGKYAVVEQTMKEYLNEASELVKQASTIYDTSEIENILSAENCMEDGPEFTKSKELLANFKTKSNEYIDSYNNLMKEENMMKAIEDKGLNDYYKELYRNFMLSDQTRADLQEATEQLNTVKADVEKSIVGLENILNFLSENSDSWEIVDNKIQFKTQAKLNEYLELVNSIVEE